MIRRIAVLATVLALAVPAAASATPNASSQIAQERYYSSYGDARQDLAAAAAQERYYSSYGEPEPAANPAPSTPAGDDAPWKVLAIVSGALVFALLAAEIVTLTRLRRAT
jgi:hypothetical protein